MIIANEFRIICNDRGYKGGKSAAVSVFRFGGVIGSYFKLGI